MFHGSVETSPLSFLERHLLQRMAASVKFDTEIGQAALGHLTPRRLVVARKTIHSASRPMQPSDRVTAELESGYAPKRVSDKVSGGRSLMEGNAIQHVTRHLLAQGMAERVAFITRGLPQG